jgi:hypothetical protein
MIRWWVWLVGAAISLLAELTHELVENSEWMIQLYRNNSGTSGLYQGDSSQNIGNESRVMIMDNINKNQSCACRALSVTLQSYRYRFKLFFFNALKLSLFIFESVTFCKGLQCNG